VSTLLGQFILLSGKLGYLYRKSLLGFQSANGEIEKILKTLVKTFEKILGP